MPKHIFPNTETRRWRQPNSGDIWGDLFASKNIDLKTERGKILTARRMEAVNTSNDNSNLQRPTAALRSSADGTDGWWALCNTRLFKTTGAGIPTDPTASYAADAIANTPTSLDYRYSDMEDWEGDLIVSRSTDLERLSGGAWTNSWWTGSGQLNQAALTASIYHPVKRIFNGSLLVGDDRYVHQIVKNDQGSVIVHRKRLILPPGYRVRWIKTSLSRAWIGANNRFSGEAAVFEWNGSDENYSSPSPYFLKHRLALSAAVKDDVLYVLNGQGIIMRISENGGFSEFAKFPVAKDGILDDGGAIPIQWRSSTSEDHMVHPNGMDVANNEIHILLSGAINSTDTILLEEFLSGIWVLDEDTRSLYLKHSLCQSKEAATQVDFGTEVIVTPGFLKATYDENEFICGAAFYTDNATTLIHGIFARQNSTAGCRGYFVTSKIQSSDVQALWKALWLKFRQFEDEDDRIVVKYRTQEDTALSFRAGITWASTTTFTMSQSANTDNVADGDEVEITTGRGAGAIVHVSGAPSLSAGIYTVTINEAIANVSGTAQCRFRNWRRLVAISDTSLDHEFVRVDGAAGNSKQAKWIQFKVELRADMNGGARGVALEEMQLISEPAKRAEE